MTPLLGIIGSIVLSVLIVLAVGKSITHVDRGTIIPDLMYLSVALLLIAFRHGYGFIPLIVFRGVMYLRLLR